jgi:hypothetical protein
MPQSHQTFRPNPNVKLLEIMLRNGCWPITFHTITTRDANGWCLKWLVWLAPQCQVACEHGLLLAITWRLGATHITSIYHDIIKISCKMKWHEYNTKFWSLSDVFIEIWIHFEHTQCLDTLILWVDLSMHLFFRKMCASAVNVYILWFLNTIKNIIF